MINLCMLNQNLTLAKLSFQSVCKVFKDFSFICTDDTEFSNEDWEPMLIQILIFMRILLLNVNITQIMTAMELKIVVVFSIIHFKCKKNKF